MMKKTIALLLAFLIILSSAPAFTAYAQESPEQPVTLEAEGEPAADEEPNEEQESDEQFFPGEMNLFKGESAAIRKRFGQLRKQQPRCCNGFG